MCLIENSISTKFIEFHQNTHKNYVKDEKLEKDTLKSVAYSIGK